MYTSLERHSRDLSLMQGYVKHEVQVLQLTNFTVRYRNTLEIFF